MGRLIYSCITSLDGYMNDENGGFEWSTPDEEVHAFINEAERPIGTYLYGRRLYETMAYWESPPPDGVRRPVSREYASIWRAAEKVVYSTTLPAVWTAHTRLEPTFEPDAVRDLKESSEQDLSIGGAELASHALRAGLVDELHQFVAPVVVGAGTSWLPPALQQSLELLDAHQFASGFVHVGYRIA
jgi:dihydrofolate reductase